MEGMGDGLMGLPEVVHRLICSFFINGHNWVVCFYEGPFWRTSNREWLPMASACHALRRMYLGWRPGLTIDGRRASVASLVRLRSAMVNLRKLRVSLEAPALGVLREALLQGGWEGVQALRLDSYSPEGAIDPADYASGALPLEHLPGLRSLKIYPYYFSDAHYAMSMLRVGDCPLLESLDCCIPIVEDDYFATFTALLNARSAAKCSPLRRFRLALERAWDEEEEDEDEDEEEMERVEGLRELLLSPYLTSVEVFGLTLNPERWLLHPDTVAIVGEYLGRLGRGQLKGFSLYSTGGLAWPDSFLSAVRGGALSGLETLGFVEDDAQCVAMVQPLVEGGGCPRATVFDKPHLCWLLEGALAGAFPALEQLTSYWCPERLQVLSQCLVEGKLPRLKTLCIEDCYWPQRKATLDEGLEAFVGAAERGALHKLNELKLRCQAWSVRMLKLLVNTLEGGYLPALKHLQFSNAPMAEEVVQVLGDALGRGCFRGVEQLELDGCIGGAGNTAHIIRGLREGHFEGLVELILCDRYSGVARPLLVELLSAIDRARFPHLRKLGIGATGRHDRADQVLAPPEGMSWLTIY